jgi:hypothetical protein
MSSLAADIGIFGLNLAAFILLTTIAGMGIGHALMALGPPLAMVALLSALTRRPSTIKGGGRPG